MSKLVSIIMPCHNGADHLAETLDNLLQQQYAEWECIIVDNASTDDTRKVAEKYCEKDKRFRYEYLSQKGVSLARNTGVKLSKGTYILPLDADDKIDPTYIQKAVELLKKDPTIKLVYAEAKLFDAVNRAWILPQYSFKNMLIENCIYCSAVFRKSDFDKTPGYNEAMVEGFEDWDFWLTFLKKDDEVYKIPEILFFYRIRNSSRNNSLDEDKQLKLRRQIFENHRSLYATYLDADFVFEHYKIKNQLKALLKSKGYKLGKLLVNPFIAMRKLKK